MRAAARALEALVLKRLVSASGAFRGGESAGSAVREDLFASTLADALAQAGGLGLAAQIERDVLGPSSRSPPAPAPAPDAGPGAAPLDLPARQTSAFGPRADPFTGRPAIHHGVDLAAPEGAAIHAAFEGVVRSSGARGGYGLSVEIDHGGGVTTLYAHASELLVRDGEQVTRGQPIARVGSTGRATGPHLHLEVRQGGRPVDPGRALKIYGGRADDLLGDGF